MGEILARRGFSDLDSVRAFLYPRLEDLHDPFLLPDMERAATRLWQAVDRKETILVHGDYDVDGVTATTLLVEFFQSLGVRILYTLPNRLLGGYGLSGQAVDKAHEHGASVLVTVDCGISDHEQVARAGQLGIDTIVTDHHLPGDDLPPALAVVAASREDSRYPHSNLAGVGVAYKLLEAMTQLRPGSGACAEDGLDLVALGTIADVVPLAGENRILVTAGLEKLARPSREGLRALKKVSGFGRDAPVSGGQVGFRLAPRLNAAGRLGMAERAADLLLCKDASRAMELAGELNEENDRRRKMDQLAFEKAVAGIEKAGLGERRVIVLGFPYSPDSPDSSFWHPGVIGIVASRLVRQYHVPAILVAFDGEIGKGSGRSIEQFHLADALGECREWLISCGGHKQAAGLAVQKENFAKFKEKMESVAAERISREMTEPELKMDLEVPLAGCTQSVVEDLRRMQPFGMGNREPVLVSVHTEVVGVPRVVRGGHLKFTVRQDATTVDAIAFGMSNREDELNQSGKIDLAFALSEDRWSGHPQLNVKDFRQSR